ncbi:killer cell lectin-like receptor subfamily F member 1 [Terrapene carolina triunguis]|uniref:killer cell lectin-like receptor subfamily F member 1 n=1 Tax=Terrapene triunguis TaxID=2587831 RepID=UPI00115646F1|nr:killer cell lectin-like receptor subfamily F member 1 [Terrapene carolina triunguis]
MRCTSKPLLDTEIFSAKGMRGGCEIPLRETRISSQREAEPSRRYTWKDVSTEFVLLVNHLTGPPGCRLCPLNWLLHGDKCYWLSKESKNWNESREDCSAKSSRMLVIQDQRAMEFIKTLTEGKYPVWIGLHLTTSKGNWTWVDGSLLNQTGVSLSAPDTGNSCGVWKENQIRGEICSGTFKWICQREAVLI